MGLMNRLRDKTHIILIILVIAFLATIVFEWGMNYLGLRSGETYVFASVNGTELSYEKFEEQVQLYAEEQKRQTGEDPDESLLQMIREQVWERFIQQILIEQEIDKLGIRVTDQEIKNWVFNSPQTLPDDIKRFFIDSTGQFDYTRYQQAIQTQTPEVQRFWVQVEDRLRQILLNQKLMSIITGSVRVSEADVIQKYKDEKIAASFNYILLPLTSITDDMVQITEDELKAYYDNNKNDYKSDETAKLKYILFSDQPTAEDSAITEKQLRALTKEFKRATAEDSSLIVLVNTNSTVKWNDKFIKPNEVSPEVASFLFNAKKDSVSDVIKSSDGYTLVRLLDTKEGDDVFINASHILISFGTDTAAAKVKAEQILQRVKNGEDFAKMAAEFSDDPGSKQNGGNLGYFTKGSMVKEFEEACMTGRVGEITGLVKTQYGYHIIKINDRQKKEFKAAIIKKPVKTSTKTRDAVKKRADDFAYIARKGNFDEEAGKLNLKPTDIPSITKTSFIPGAGQNQSVTKFAFSESKGSVSDAIKIQGGYAVYYLVDKNPEGFMKFEEIKETMIKPRVVAEKKLDLLKQNAQQLKGMIQNNDLTSLKNVNKTIDIQSADSVTVAKPNAAVGSEPELLAAIFKLQNSQISDPIRTPRGYFLIQMKSITPFDQQKFTAESETIKNNLINQKKQTILQDWITDLKEKADIVDNRDKYYR
jgi:parvulin-like peptidyl-prolyl isomerase